MSYTTEEVHISTIGNGDTIIHNGDMTTVNNKDIKYCSFMGHSIFGDSYRSGTIKVKKVLWQKLTHTTLESTVNMEQ